MRLDEGRFFLRGEVEVHQGQVQLGEAARLAEQPAVDLGLGPVQGPVVGRLPGQITATRLDLFEPAQGGVVAIGPASYNERTELAAQADLCFVSGTTAAGDGMV